MLTHRSAVALLSWARGHFSSQHLARVLASTSICFDLSIFELWGPLCAGGAVLLTQDVVQGFPWAAEQAATLLNTVPSVLSALLSMSTLPTSVRIVNLAGEPLSAPLVQQVYAQGVSSRSIISMDPARTRLTPPGLWFQRTPVIQCPLVALSLTPRYICLTPKGQFVPIRSDSDSLAALPGYLLDPQIRCCHQADERASVPSAIESLTCLPTPVMGNEASQSARTWR